MGEGFLVIVALRELLDERGVLVPEHAHQLARVPLHHLAVQRHVPARYSFLQFCTAQNLTVLYITVVLVSKAYIPLQDILAQSCTAVLVSTAQIPAQNRVAQFCAVVIVGTAHCTTHIPAE